MTPLAQEGAGRWAFPPSLPPPSTPVYCSLFLYVPGHLLRMIKAGQRPSILSLLNVTLSPPLHINHRPPAPVWVVSFPLNGYKFLERPATL